MLTSSLNDVFNLLRTRHMAEHCGTLLPALQLT